MEGLIFGILRYVVSRRSRIVTAKKCTKKAWYTRKIVVVVIKPICFCDVPVAVAVAVVGF